MSSSRKNKIKPYWSMRVLLSIALIGSLHIVQSGCGESPKEEKQAGTKEPIKMGTSADQPPFEFYRTGDGETQIVGYDIDLAKKIGEELGNTVEIKDMDFSTLIPALQAGRVDFVMAGMTPTPERKQNVDFSISYLKFPVTAITQKQLTVQSAQDLKGKKIGVQLGSAHEQIAKEWAKDDPSITVVSLNKLGDLIQELIVGRIDAALMETAVAHSYVKLTPQLKVNLLPKYQLEFAVAFQKGSPLVEKFNKIIDQLEKSGQLEALKKKWITKD
jgi:polar amino acid transport system substrate-binding protein